MFNSTNFTLNMLIILGLIIYIGKISIGKIEKILSEDNRPESLYCERHKT